MQAAIEITCSDCHGTATGYPDLKTHGPAAPPGGTDLGLLRNADGRARFEWRDGKLFQRSTVYPGLEWEMKLVKDTVSPGNPNYNPLAARAKLMSKGAAMKWGPGIAEKELAHSNDDMACYRCRPAQNQTILYRNGAADEVIFVYHGGGVLESSYGKLDYREGDYVVIPRGTTYRIVPKKITDEDYLILEAEGAVRVPPKYMNKDGQIKEVKP